MDLWFSEVHTPDVKLSLRTAKQLYAGKSEWQDIEVLDTPAFGKILILNGHVLFSDADDFVYNEMTVHVPWLCTQIQRKSWLLEVVTVVLPKY